MKEGRSTFIHCLSCSNRPHACAGEVGSQSCAPPAQMDHSFFLAWWWDSEHFHQPTSQHHSGPALKISRRRRAVQLWRYLLRPPDTLAGPQSGSAWTSAEDSRLSLERRHMYFMLRDVAQTPYRPLIDNTTIWPDFVTFCGWFSLNNVTVYTGAYIMRYWHSLWDSTTFTKRTGYLSNRFYYSTTSQSPPHLGEKRRSRRHHSDEGESGVCHSSGLLERGHARHRAF